MLEVLYFFFLLMEGLNSINVTAEALRFLSEAYLLCQVQLDKYNVTLPEIDRVAKVTSTTIRYALDQSPIAQLLASFTDLPLHEYNFLTIFLALVSLYTIFNSILFMFRMACRFFYGFIRFSSFILIGYGLFCAYQTYVERVKY